MAVHIRREAVADIMAEEHNVLRKVVREIILIHILTQEKEQIFIIAVIATCLCTAMALVVVINTVAAHIRILLLNIAILANMPLVAVLVGIMLRGRLVTVGLAMVLGDASIQVVQLRVGFLITLMESASIPLRLVVVFLHLQPCRLSSY